MIFIHQTFAEQIYETLCDQQIDSARVPGVENLFAENAPCQTAYENMLDAYSRLREKLKCGDEDPDAEIMIRELLFISREIGLRMFEYGVLSGKK